MDVLSKSTSEVAYDEQTPEPTLGTLATRLARTTVPRRLYQVLHLALPISIDLAMRGWWRGAGWSLAIASFGAWGLADHWLAESARDNPARARWVKLARVVAGGLAIAPPIVLLLDAFLRLLGNAPISRTGHMPAYIVVEVDVHDRQRYDRYKELAPPSIYQYGGRYIARGGACETLEGDWHPPRFVILEFENAERARAWWASPEYAEAKKLRHATATSRMLLVDGLPPGWTP